MQSGHASQCGGKRTKGVLPNPGPDHPLITVITVVFNASTTIEATIKSILGQTYPSVEYIIIDGGSTDGTLDIIRKYEHAIDYWLSEADKGLYDAMNKGIAASTGTWLNFMNANDVFYSPTTVDCVATNYFQSTARFVYSDVFLTARGSTPVQHKCDHQKLILNHQASMYRKSLHSDHGLYLVAPGITISDYLFFSLIDKADFLKSDYPIAIYDTTGISQSKRALEQKFIVDFLINGMPKYKFTLYFQLYYYYRAARQALSRLWIH